MPTTDYQDFDPASTVLTSTLTPALPGIVTIPLWDGSATPLHLVRFTADSFDPASFALHGIACPPTVARSVRKRQAEFFAGRLAARRALAPLGLAHSEIGIGAHRQPVWPQGVEGSISHHRCLAAAVAIAQPPQRGAVIGVDLETIVGDSHDELAALAGMVVSGAELALLRHWQSQWQLPLNTLLTLVFSAKESFFKASFALVGHYFDFDAVTIEEIDPDRHCLTLVVRQALCPELPPGTAIAIHFVHLDQTTICTSCCWRNGSCSAASCLLTG